jgi:RNA polymerase sigma factor (sigma-70 family)
MKPATAILTWPGRTDEQLADGYLLGDGACLEELVRRYSGQIYGFILRMVGRPEDAEDLTQEVFVQLLRSLPSARTDTPLRPWIFVIARNKCLDHLKRRRAVPFTDLSESDDGEVTVTDEQPLPEELAERADLAEVVQRAISTLPHRYRAVVAMRYSTDLTFAEIGQVLGLPENTVKTHFQRAKAILRTQLSSLRQG